MIFFPVNIVISSVISPRHYRDKKFQSHKSCDSYIITSNNIKCRYLKLLNFSLEENTCDVKLIPTSRDIAAILKCVILQHILMIDIPNIASEIAHRTSLMKSQHWLRLWFGAVRQSWQSVMLPYGVTRCQWVKIALVAILTDRKMSSLAYISEMNTVSESSNDKLYHMYWIHEYFSHWSV